MFAIPVILKIQIKPITKIRRTQNELLFFKNSGSAFDEAIENVTAALQEKGFGILTEIDVTETLKKKLDVDFYKYRILGACNPQFAYQALQVENKVGTMLPCNVIVQEFEDGKVDVTAIDPMASMKAVENPKLEEIAEEVRNILKSVIANL